MSRPSPTTNLRVLISGAGIAGLVAAYWLGKAGVSVTVLERADEIRKSGHIISIRQVAVPILRHMGIEEDIIRCASLERGIQIVDQENRVWASFPHSDASFSSGLELDRGQLLHILYEISKDKATFILGNWIQTIEENHDSLKVSLANGNLGVMEFDALLVAEGLSSRTRAKVFNEDVRKPIFSLNQWAASFSYKLSEQWSASFSYKSSEQWARWYNIAKHQCLLVRPHRSGRAFVLAMCRSSGESDSLILRSHIDKEKQRQHFLQLFEETGWESNKIMRGLSDAEDLHVQEMAQVKCETWSQGRAVLVGDTAYCPSPVGGTGTSAAIVGAYILAAELIKNPGNHQLAFLSYETAMRPWIQIIQRPAPKAIRIGMPGTRFGICCFRLLVYILSSTLASALFSLVNNLNKWLGITTKRNTPIIPHPSLFELH